MFVDRALEVRDKIKDMQELAPWLVRLRETAEKLLKKEPEAILLSDFLRFYEDGDRGQFETKYFDRRERLASYALMIFIYRDMRFLKPLENIIWMICEETTWVLPAHIWENIYAYRHWIDLFCAETGSALAEINYLLADVLSPRVRDRIHKEVHERIVDTYLDSGTDLYWYHYDNNWVAVCASGCTAACIYEGNRFEADAAVAKSEPLMEKFLSGFSEDGMCMEGYAYWNYGFGYFLYYADLVRGYTDGKIDHMNNERVHNVARFLNKGQIRPGAAIVFGDGDSTEGAYQGDGYYIAANYDDIELPSGGWNEYDHDRCCRWLRLVRCAVWPAVYCDRVAQESEKKYGTEIYSGAEWYIKKTPKYILCAKGGHNNEMHNHNDVGSFYIDDYSAQVLADFGWGEYTRDYFTPEHRYSYFVCGSQGHNLPIINGCTQSPGEEYRAQNLRMNDDIFGAELVDAYDVLQLESFVRTIAPSDGEITISDSFRGDLVNITERFVSRECPQVNGSTVKIRNAVLECAAESVTEPKIQRVVYKSHDFALDTEAWTIDYEVKPSNVTTFELKIKFLDGDE